MSDAGFHLGQRTPDTRTEVSGSASNAIVTMLRSACEHGHYWQTEQQTGHKVCGWCNACDDSRCSA